MSSKSGGVDRPFQPSDTIMPKSKQTLKLSKKMKGLSADALASKSQAVGKALPQYKTKAPIERPKPKLRPLNESEKRVRALNKKLREIEALREREAKGETLDEAQLAMHGRVDGRNVARRAILCPRGTKARNNSAAVASTALSWNRRSVSAILRLRLYSASLKAKFVPRTSPTSAW